MGFINGAAGSPRLRADRLTLAQQKSGLGSHAGAAAAPTPQSAW